MKKILLTTTSVLLATISVLELVVTGPRTIFNVDASTAGQYTFYSLRDKKVIPTTDSATTNWDVAFSKTNIIFNSGTSGPGTIEAQLIKDAWVNVHEAPVSGYSTDNTTSKVIPTGSGNGWYTYNPTNHAITPIPYRTAVIKWADGKHAKLEVISYCKNAPLIPSAETGFYTFRYLLADSTDLTQHIDSAKNIEATTKAYFNLANGELIAPADSATDKWDVSFNGTNLVVNSGAGKNGNTLGQFVEVPFNELFFAPDGNYKTGVDAVPSGTDNGWYHYDFLVTHTVTPIEGRTLVFQDKFGRYSKMEIKSYYKDAPANPTLLNTAKFYTFNYYYQPDGTVNLNPNYVAPNQGTGITANNKAVSVFNLYPNPAKGGAFTIGNLNGEVLQSVTIFSLDGKMVYAASKAELTIGKIEVNLPTGIYVIALNTNTITQIERLQVVK